MNTRFLILVTAMLVTGCGGGGDDKTPATTSTKSSPFAGIYTQVVDQKGARKIPDRALGPDTYRLVLEEETYQLHAERGPFGGGTLEADTDELRFGPNADSGCRATGIYKAARSGSTLRLIAKQDECPDRKALWTLGEWTVAE